MSQTNEYNNPLSNPCDIKENNMNSIEATGSLQNACSVLLTAHFGFIKLGLLAHYRLTDSRDCKKNGTSELQRGSY